MAAKFGALGLTALVPILTADGNYTPAFVIGASLAVIAMLAVWFLIPKIEPLKKSDNGSDNNSAENIQPLQDKG